MKLHLPKQLRSAVMACMAAIAALSTTIGTGVITTGAVAYTLAAAGSTASAAEYTIDVSTAVEIMFNDGAGNKHLSEAKAGDIITLNVTQPSGNGGYFENLGNNETKTIAADIVINSLVFNNGYSGSNRTYLFTGNISGSGDFTRGANQFGNIFRFTGDVSGYTGAISFATKAGNEANKLFFDASSRAEGMTVNASSITMQTGSMLETAGKVTLNSTVNAAAMTIDAGALTLGEGASITTQGALTFNLNGAAADVAPMLTVGPGTLTYGSLALSNYSSLDGGVYSLVSTTAEQATAMATALNMTEGQYIVSADGGMLKLTVASGPAPITGTQNIAYGAATRADGYEIQSGGNLRINNGSGGVGGAAAGAVSNIGPVTVQNGGTLTIWACQFGQKNLNTDNKVNIANDITIEDGGKVFIQDGSYNFTGTLAVSGNALFESQYAKGYTFSALSGDADSTLTIQQDNNDRDTATVVNLLNANTAFNGTLVLKDINTRDIPVSLNVAMSNADSLANAKVVFDAASTANTTNLVLNTAAANVGSVSGAGNIITSSEMKSSGGTAGAVTEGTLTITGTSAAGAADFTGTVSGGVTLAVADGGVLSLGNITLGHTIANSGTVNIASGSTITLSTLTGWEGDSSLSEGDNGFMTISKLYVVQGGTINASNISVVAEGDTKTLQADGSIAFSGDTDYTVYYLNTGSKALSAITTAASGALEKVVMKNNAMLTGITSAEGLSGDIGFEHETEFAADGSIPTAITGNATYGNLTGTGDIAINNGATLTITGVNSGDINFNISADGRLVFSGAGTMTIGNVKNDGDTSNNYNREMIVGSGVTLNAASVVNSWGMKSLTVDGTLNVTGELKFSTGGNAAGTNVIGGSGSITAGTLTIANASSINTISVNSLTVTGNASIGRATEVTGGTTTIQGNTTIGAALAVNGGNLVLGDAVEDTVAINAATNLTAGSLTIKGDATLGTNGALNVNGGSLIVDGNLNLKGTLENKASVTLNGTMSATASSLESNGDAGYTDEKAPESGNGYLNGSFYLVKAADGASATSALGASADVVLDGAAVGHSALSAADGNIICNISSDNYYINNGTVIYGDAGNSAADAKTTGLILNGGNLTLSQALNTGVGITAAQAGTLNIGEGITVSADVLTRNATVTLDGTGTYAVTTAADLNSIAYASDWAGTVSVDAGAGNTIAIGTYPGSGTLSILSGTVDHNHGNVATLNCGLNIAAGATYQDYGNYKWALNLVGDLAGEGTMLSKTPTVTGQGDGFRQVTLSGKTADFTGEWQLENAYSDNATGNRRISGRLNSADGVFGGVVSFVAVTDGENAPSADKTVSELRLMKSMTIGGVQGSLGTIVAESADTALIINVASGKDLTYSGKLDMANIKTLTVAGEGTQTFSGITSTGAGVIVVGSAGAPLFTGDNSISNLTIESGATLSNAGSIAITGSMTLNETLNTDSTLTLGEGATIIVTDSTAFEKSATTKRVDALGRETAATGNGFDADGGITLVKGTAAAGVDGSATIDGTTYTVTDGAVDMATFNNYFVTSTDTEITATTVAAYATEKGSMLSSIIVSGGSEFAVDAETINVRTTDGGGTLTVTDSLYTLELGADTQVDSTAAIYDVTVTAGDSTISGEGTVGTVHVSGGSLTTEVGTAAVEVTDGSATIGGDSGALTISGGSATIEGNSGAVTATGGTTTVEGNVGGAISTNGEGTVVNVGGNVSGSITADNGEVKFLASETPHTAALIDLSHGNTALGHVAIAAGASVVQSGDLWMRSANAGVLLEEGGSLTTKQGSVTVTGLEGGGSVTISEGQNYYQTNVDKFVFTNVAVSTANEGSTSLSTHLSGATVENLGAGLLTVISDGAGSITSVAATNGNVAVNGRTDETAIAIDSVTLGAGKSLTLGGDTNIGSLDVDLATYVTEVPTEALTLISTAAGKSLTFDTLDTSAKVVTIGDKSYLAQLTLSENTLTLAYSEATSMYWNGGSGNLSDAAWSAEGGSTAGDLPFVAGAVVVFDGEGGTIAVDTPATVGSMTVSGNYGFTSAADLTITGTLTVDEGATASIDALPTVDDIVVNADSTLGLAANKLRPSAETLLSKTTGEGTVQLNSGTGFGNDNNRISISDRTVTAATNLDITNDIAVNGWKSNDQTGVTGSLVLTKDTTVGGEIRMETGAKLVIGEGASLTANKLSLGHASESAMAVGHLEMTGGTLNVGTIGLNNNQANTMTVTGGTVTITGANAFDGAGTGTTVSIANATLATDGEHSWMLNHSATLTDVTIAAAEGTTITIGGEGLTTTVNGTLTNTGAMALGSDLSVGALNNSGSIDLGSNALTLTQVPTTGGTLTNIGTLTLAGGENGFTALSGDTLDLSATGATLNVTDAMTLSAVTLGTVNNTMAAGSLGGALGLAIDAAELNSGTHTVLTLGTAYEGTATLTVGEQTINLGDSATALDGTNKLVQLAMNESGTAMNIIVSYAGGVWNGGEPGDESAEWTDETVPGDTITFDGTNGAPEVVINGDKTMETVVVSGEEGAKEYTFTGDGSVETTTLDMSGNGTLTVDTEMSAETAKVAGNATLSVGENGDLSIDTLTMDTNNALTVDEGGSLTIGSIADSGSSKEVSIVNDGTLTVTGTAAIDSLTGEGTLNITEEGTVTLTDSATLADVTGDGALVVNGALTADSVSGNAVTADTVALNSVGNEISSLTTDTLIVTTVEGIGAATTQAPHANAYVEVEDVQAKTEGCKITIVLTDDAVDEVVNELASTSKRDYLIVEGEQDMSNTFVLSEQQQQGFLKDGIKTSLAWGSAHMVARTLAAAEKSWTVGDAATAAGLEITTTGTDAYSELDTAGVENVFVAADTMLNLTGEPATVVLKNLTSQDGATLTVTGDAEDAVIVKGTSAASAYDVPGAHDGSLVVDTLTATAAGKTTPLAALALKNGAKANTTDGAAWTVGQLNAENAAAGTIEGMYKVTGQGGSYLGSYGPHGATVALASGAKQTLIGGETLGLTGSGTAHLLGDTDGIARVGALAMNGKLHIGDNVLSATGSLAGGTLYADFSAAEVMDGMPRTLTLDGSSLNMRGTTIVLTQTDTVPGTMTVDPTTELVIATLGDGTETNGATRVVLNSPTLSKYFVGAVVKGNEIVAERNAHYFSENVLPGVNAPNAKAGLAMLDAALLELNPQVNNPEGALAGIMDALETHTAGDPQKLAASVAGSGLAGVSMAVAGDVERQLRAIRNRTTTMGVDQCVVNEDMPYVNAWINAEGDYAKLNAEGTKAGYTMSSWGGTVGFDVDCTPRFTCGMALSAMYGDFKSTDVDQIDGDINNYYVSAFARYSAHRWTHTGVATFGISDLTLNRTINYGMGTAKMKGDTNGTSFGAMYEVGYVMALDEDMTTCLQPIANVTFRHIGVDGYTESGSDAALKVDDMDANIVTFGLGARLQSVVGENIYNRSSIFECRAMLKLDAGDTEGEAKTALKALNGHGRTVKGAEMGNVGFEIGAGLTVPVGQDAGSIFIDASAEFRGSYSSVNGTVGYRINF